MIGPTCPKCGYVTHETRAIGIFRPDGPIGYRAGYSDAPLFDTRWEAEVDMCEWRIRRQEAAS